MRLINSDCIIAMKEMKDNSVDSIVTDPPYELGFMGKSWDSTGIANSVEMWSQALRVLKPGGHLIAFSGSRTYHRMAVAIEDAGFEIRDQIMWVYGSGFPKSMNVSKAIEATLTTGNSNKTQFSKLNGEKIARRDANGLTGANEFHDNRPDDYTKTAQGNFLSVLDPTTPEAQQWQGWGTALKPAHEPMVLARKPIVGTVANNVLTYGTGGLNIDGSRVGRAAEWIQSTQGRFPANFIHDGSDEVVELFPTLHGSGNKSDTGTGTDKNYDASSYQISYSGRANRDYGSKGGSAARFFYCAKASKRDRNEGLDGFEEKQVTGGGGLTANLREDGSLETASAGGKYGSIKAKQTNSHPTVKPTDLMRYLCRLITPPNGIVLDPFMGSGSTGKACAYEGFDFIGIDQSADYVEIARARIEFALLQEETKEMELPF